MGQAEEQVPTLQGDFSLGCILQESALVLMPVAQLYLFVVKLLGTSNIRLSRVDPFISTTYYSP